MKNKKVFLLLGASVLLGALFMLASKVYQDSEREKMKPLALENQKLFVPGHAARYGEQTAKVYLVEFLDPECESCRAFYPQVKMLLEKYQGQVQLVVRYAPFHKNSLIAVRALEAARVQGLYWEAMELLFETQPMWGDHHNPRPELIFEYLPRLNLDMERLKLDMQSDKITALIEADVRDLKALNVRKTPTFFVNGVRLERFGLSYLDALVQQEIEKVY